MKYVDMNDQEFVNHIATKKGGNVLMLTDQYEERYIAGATTDGHLQDVLCNLPVGTQISFAYNSPEGDVRLHDTYVKQYFGWDLISTKTIRKLQGEVA